MILLELRRSSHGAITGKSPIERDRRRAHTDPFGAQRELVPNDFVWSVGPRFHSCGRALWYRSRATEIGLSANPWPYVITAVAIVVGCTATGMAGRGGAVSYAGPLLVIGLGYLVFGRLDRSLLVAAFGAAMAIVAIIVFVLKPQHVYTLTMLPFGAGSALLGLWNLRQARRID